VRSQGNGRNSGISYACANGKNDGFDNATDNTIFLVCFELGSGRATSLR